MFSEIGEALALTCIDCAAKRGNSTQMEEGNGVKCDLPKIQTVHPKGRCGSHPTLRVGWGTRQSARRVG